jgi:hypothetical protein
VPAETSPETIDAINEALFGGDVIRAVRIYRAATNVRLPEANTFVAALNRRLRAEMPERFPAPAWKKSQVGWSSLAVILAIWAAKIAIFRLLR